jgi:transposase
LQANEAEGIKLSRKQVAEALNVSVGTVLEAARDLRAARSVEQYTYTKAQDTHVEARVKARLAELEATFEKRVQEANQKQIKILFPDLKAIQDRAALTEKLYRSQLEKIAILTEAEYRDILLCTHEGNPSPETRKRAFIALNAKKLQLTGKA